VLIYEGIRHGGFDYDYSPVSVMVGSKRVWMNVSQEGKDDIDDMREGGLINGLKLSTEELQPVTAFQVSVEGMRLVQDVPDNLREQVDLFVLAPKPFAPDRPGPPGVFKRPQRSPP
jgi:WD repeat-containing protein 35